MRKPHAMWRSSVAAMLTLGLVQSAYGQNASSTVLTTTSTAQALQEQKAAIGAADSFAATLAPSRDTPSYVLDLKNALKLINLKAATSPIKKEPAKIDQDTRYIEHLKDLVSISDPNTADKADRIWLGLPTRGYLNTVAIKFSRELCTGVVVTQNAVLTAAHCVCKGPIQEISVGSYADDQTNTRYQKSSIASATPMRKCGSEKSIAADVALITLTKNFDPRVKPVIFASSGTINEVSFVRAVGFGSTQNGSAGQKLYVDVPTATINCNGSVKPSGGGAIQSDQNWYGCSPTFELVAGKPLLNKDTCHGDSGGPIFFHADDGNGGYQEFLAGITSRNVGSPRARDCGDGGIYERVDGPVRDWLVQVQKLNLAFEGSN